MRESKPFPANFKRPGPKNRQPKTENRRPATPRPLPQRPPPLPRINPAAPKPHTRVEIRDVFHRRDGRESAIVSPVSIPSRAVVAIDAVPMDRIVRGVIPAREIPAVPGPLRGAVRTPPCQKDRPFRHAPLDPALADQFPVPRGQALENLRVRRNPSLRSPRCTAAQQQTRHQQRRKENPFHHNTSIGPIADDAIPVAPRSRKQRPSNATATAPAANDTQSQPAANRSPLKEEFEPRRRILLAKPACQTAIVHRHHFTP